MPSDQRVHVLFINRSNEKEKKSCPLPGFEPQPDIQADLTCQPLSYMVLVLLGAHKMHWAWALNFATCTAQTAWCRVYLKHIPVLDNRTTPLRTQHFDFVHVGLLISWLLNEQQAIYFFGFRRTSWLIIKKLIVFEWRKWCKHEEWHTFIVQNLNLNFNCLGCWGQHRVRKRLLSHNNPTTHTEVSSCRLL